MIFQRTKIAEQLFSETNTKRIKLINFVVEILKRNNIGNNTEKQSISYSSEEIEILKKIVSFILFIESKECSDFRTTSETKVLIENLLTSLRESKPLLIFALFCPSYKKEKEIFGFNREIGETTKKGINNLNILSEKATSSGIKNEVYAIYSDLVLENLEKLKKNDFIDLETNFQNFVEYGKELNSSIKLVKLSQVENCNQKIGLDGIAFQTELPKRKIQIIVNRSKPFYEGVLGWEEKLIEQRTKVLAKSCATMTEEIRKINPLLLMVMTENIYERGIFYYSDDIKNPIPIFYSHKTETKIDRITLA